MIDKYKYYEIFELENGWLLKINNPETAHKASSSQSHKSYYCKDKKDLLNLLNSEIEK